VSQHNFNPFEKLEKHLHAQQCNLRGERLPLFRRQNPLIFLLNRAIRIRLRYSLGRVLGGSLSPQLRTSAGLLDQGSMDFDDHLADVDILRIIDLGTVGVGG